MSYQNSKTQYNNRSSHDYKTPIDDYIHYIGKDSEIRRNVNAIQRALESKPEIEIRCAGTASEKGILIAESCVDRGFAKYSRFTTQTVLHNDKQIVFVIIKLRRQALKRRYQQEQRPSKYTEKQQRKPQNQSRGPPKENPRKYRQGSPDFDRVQSRHQNRQGKSSHQNYQRQDDYDHRQDNSKKYNTQNDYKGHGQQGRKTKGQGQYREVNKEREYR